MARDEKARFDEAVQAEVAKQMAAMQEQFAAMMQSAMQSSLAGVDGANAALAREREAVAQELDAAREARRKAEREGEKIADEFFAKSRAAIEEFDRKDLLRTLVHENLKKGREIEEICDWLQVEPEFVERMIELMDRRVNFLREAASKSRLRIPGNPKLRYKDSGRSGTIVFENDVTTFEMWWEFGAGNAMVLVDIPSKRAWENRTKLPLEERDATLRFIAEQVVEDQAPLHAFEIGDSAITILR